MSTTTPNFGYTLPAPLSPVDQNVWGGMLNGNLSSQDTYLNSAANTFIGATAPAVPALVAGRQWINTSSSPYILSVYDGAIWLTIGTIDPVAHTWTPSGIVEVPSVINSNVQVFSSSGTYTASAGLLFAKVEVLGGGGGGGSGGPTFYNGGSAGGYSVRTLSATAIGASQSVTVGAGGGSNAAGSGSSFGALLASGGGLAGTTGGTATPAGGSASSGAGILGVVGQRGGAAATTGGITGDGGDAIYGGGGRGTNVSGGSPTSATGYGSGGGGGWNSAGGSGAGGIVIVTEYLSS